MNIWILGAVFVGLIAIAGITVVNALTTDDIADNTDISKCTSCGNSCTADSNCGLQSCGAVNGGTCGCGR